MPLNSDRYFTFFDIFIDFYIKLCYNLIIIYIGGCKNMPTENTRIATEHMDIDDVIRQQLNNNEFDTESDSLSAMYCFATHTH